MVHLPTSQKGIPLGCILGMIEDDEGEQESDDKDLGDDNECSLEFTFDWSIRMEGFP